MRDMSQSGVHVGRKKRVHVNHNTQPGFLETPKSESRYPSSPDIFTTGGPTSFLKSQSQSSASGSKGRFFLTLSFFFIINDFFLSPFSFKL